LQNYKRIAAVLTRKFRLVNTTNRKLMEYIDSIASHDPRFQPLHEVMDKLRENGESLDNMVNDLEREKGQIEPKISSLMLESQHLTGALILARKQLDKLMDERNSLQNRVDELEAKLEMRNKSHTRLSSKFDALRREYVSLYDLAAKGKPPKGPSLT
jgi:chromosome segregation ATPase